MNNKIRSRVELEKPTPTAMDPACPCFIPFLHHHHHPHPHHHHHHPHHHHHGHLCRQLFLCAHNRLHRHHHHCHNRHVCPNFPQGPPISRAVPNDVVRAETSQHPEAVDSAPPPLFEEEEEEEEEDEDEPVFVLTDEWRDFFAKSETKRKLEKKLAKKGKKH